MVYKQLFVVVVVVMKVVVVVVEIDVESEFVRDVLFVEAMVVTFVAKELAADGFV